MIGTVKINDRFGIPTETSDPNEAFLINLRFLYCCIKTSDELRSIDGQETQLGNMGLGEFEALISDNNESAIADFLIKFSEMNETNKKKVKAEK